MKAKRFLKTLEKIKNRFRISRVIIVADRGINQKINLKHIKDAGYGYIMAAKIKGSSAKLQEAIFADAGFTDVTDTEGKLQLRYKIMEHENIFTDEDKVRHCLSEHMIVSYSPKRAKKDEADRARLVVKAKRLLQNPGQIKSTNKRSGRKFINQTSPNTEMYELATGKIEQDARFDGFYAIQTSEKNMSAPEIMDAYHTLWKIEESFRIMKSTLEIRPVYHHKPPRIEGHFAVCFLAFLMERKMELLLKNEVPEDGSETPSSGNIQKALNSMQLAAVTTGQGEMFIKAKAHPLSSKIFNLLKLKMPENINTKNELIECFNLNVIPEPIQMSLL